ncbi:serine hydrolase domain-containing protein [Nonomuraea roseoviolacea]|uniref:D-alanyl-D-alanine carboxypeptidase n=1 Tax=Nonomuraea roseoviolacea subsp. carminata TaxID=160689 RepID=A0ABT1JY23_9ACTN|nr:serine hydrolase domain-containing protein [Nonomuraea roseoviolacea]MCP2346510.1 D-alanyl-D-alanine carboxypeptidase [Nonomuraea roseoviolacea subsp. carminata]
MSLTLSDQDKSTLRIAAYGAVSLMAAAGAAGRPHRIATDGAVALASATGLVGHVLAVKAKDIALKGESTAELADQVLPALTAAMSLLTERDPAEAGDFRRTVLVAVEAAARPGQGEPSPTMTEMARKITEALDAAGAAPAGTDRPELRKAMEEIVESGFVGVSLRVHDERGEWTGSAGAAELGGTAKPPENGHVRIGSSTKTFTAALVLRLVAEGRIALDAPVADHLPEFGLDGRITVRMLLQHTSGVFNHTGEVDADGTITPGIPIPYGATGKEWLDNRFASYRPQELVELALSKPARFEPGTGWSYSNTNYVLARLLIEKVTGRSFAEEMRRLIIGPLGLSGTVVPDTSPEIPAPYAHAYYRHEEDGRQETTDITRQNPSWVSTGGDMISTTQDLHTFVSALLGGGLLPAPLLAEMCAPRPTGIPNMDYGLGVFVVSTEGGTLISHNGAAAGHAALMYSTPDGSRTLTAALNCVDDAGLSIAAAFLNAQQRLVGEVFRGGQADPAQPAD